MLHLVEHAGPEREEELVRLLDARAQRMHLAMASPTSLMLRHPRLRSLRAERPTCVIRTTVAGRRHPRNRLTPVGTAGPVAQLRSPAMELQDHLRALGVWYFTDGMSLSEAEDLVGRIERLGYSALWLPDTVGRDPFAHIAHLAGGTTNLRVRHWASRSIFHRHPGPMQQVANTLAEQTDGRFVLGLGVQPRADGRRAPQARLLEAAQPDARVSGRHGRRALQAPSPPAQPPARLLAALGPKMIELSRDAADGAHPYWTTPEHTAQAREILGPDKLLCVEQKVVLSTDAVGRARARGASGSAPTPTCRTTATTGSGWASPTTRSSVVILGFIDAVVAWGDADAIRTRLQAHYDAGATHVCIQPLSADRGQVDWSCLEALAPAS